MLASDNANSLDLVKLLADEKSRKILLTLISRPLSIQEISAENHISIKTCYKKTRDLEIKGMIVKDDTNLSDNGKLVRYRSAFKKATIDLESGKLSIRVRNPEEMHSIWSALRTSIV